MRLFNFFYLLFLLLLQSCTHTQVRGIKAAENSELSPQSTINLYKNIAQEIKDANATDLKECNCMKAFYRNLFQEPDNTARYEFDKKTGEHAIMQSLNKDHVNVLAIGSGLLLNELTAFANILARGKSLNIYLTDFVYVFYDDPEFKEKALKYGENPENIPIGWKYFEFWQRAKDKKEEYLPFFELYHRAIDQFKIIIGNLDKIYHTKSSVTIIKPGENEPVLLPNLDMIIAIDAYLDVPGLIRNLYYKLKLPENNPPVRVLALNKNISPIGHFESDDLSEREEYSKKPVPLEIYDVKVTKEIIHTHMIEQTIIFPNEKQLKEGIDFIIKPDTNPVQSPLEINK